MKAVYSLLFIFASLVLAHSANALEWERDEHMRAALVADSQQVAAGDSIRLALVLDPDSGWHNYWQNPGDSGLATRIDWQLPDGVSASEIRWPVPELESLGELVNYGFGHQHVLLTDVRIGEQVQGPINIQATANWLVCADICIPGSADFSLSIPVADSTIANSEHSELFADAEAAIPSPAPSDWTLSYRVDESDVLFLLEAGSDALQGLTETYLFAAQVDLVDHAASPGQALSARQLAIRHPVNAFYSSVPDRFPAVLRAQHDGDTVAWQLTAERNTDLVLPALDGAGELSAQSTQPRPEATLSLLAILGFAMLGGLILNLMPCVFPVLSLKALHVAESAREHPAQQRAQGLAYTAGVLLCFLAIAAVLLALRAGGESLGWGFQLQSVWFVGLMAFLMFLVGLNLSGVFDFGTRMMGVGQNLTQRGGLSGSFFTGVLAVIVATPCTAPFMGPAMGYGLSAPVLEALLVFVALGLGMALPFLLLAFIPHVANWLPRPGRWMNTFKQVLAFPMYLTAVWLLWVLGRQTDATGMGLAAVGMVALGFAAWSWQRSQQSTSGAKAFARVCALLAVTVAGFTLYGANQLSNAGNAQASIHDADASFVAYHPERLDELRAEGKTVFINMTADWCISCLVNERTVLSREPVASLLASDEVVYMKGDWTHEDPTISAFLESYGRSGVPLYVVYHGEAEGEVLPQVLTSGTVTDALAR
jgi:thiol:disulfide interchange protein DsbD